MLPAELVADAMELPAESVAPARPPAPKIVVEPVVVVKVDPSVVTIAIRAEVVIAEEMPSEPEPKMVVEPVVVLMVDPSVVTTPTRAEVVMAEELAPVSVPLPPLVADAEAPVEVAEPEPLEESAPENVRSVEA
jgi:hypothetical protein